MKTTQQRLDLLTEIEDTPEEYIADLLKIVRLFRQSIKAQKISMDAWDEAINKLNSNSQNQEKLQKLFQSWADLEDEKEQKETLKIIESLEDVSI